MNKNFDLKRDFAVYKLNIEHKFDKILNYYDDYIFAVSRELTDFEKSMIGKYYCETLDGLFYGNYRVKTVIRNIREIESKGNRVTYFIKDEEDNGEYYIEV